MELTANNVEDTLKDSLFSDDETAEIGDLHLTTEEVLAMDDPPFLVAEGIVHSYAFHPGRLRGHAEDVRDMLMQLPEPFRESSGGGWSFLQACERADGVLWGEHRSIEQLLCMGVALGYASWLLPRAMWEAFPGGMPYVVVKDKQFA